MANGIDDRGTLLKYKNDFQGRQFCTTNIEFLFFFFLFFPNVKMASGKAFWDHSQSIWWILGTSEFFHPQLWRWLKGVAFVERRNRVVGGALGSFSIDLMGFWTIEFFYPQLWGWLKGVVFVDRWNRFVGGVLGPFPIGHPNRLGFTPGRVPLSALRGKERGRR